MGSCTHLHRITIKLSYNWKWFQNPLSCRFVYFENFQARFAKIGKLGLMPSNTPNYYAPLRQELLGKMAKIGSQSDFETPCKPWKNPSNLRVQILKGGPAIISGIVGKNCLPVVFVLALLLFFFETPSECHAFEISIDVAPNTLNMQSEGQVVTVHTSIAYSDVDHDNVYL